MNDDDDLNIKLLLTSFKDAAAIIRILRKIAIDDENVGVKEYVCSCN